MDLADAQERLWKGLYELEAAGPSGFEGFLAAALGELTGQRFHVIKSGSQGGSDVRSDPCNLVRVGLEAKQYNRKTRLSLDALLYKLTEASTADPPADFWILASTRAIDSTYREKLHGHGTRLGIGVAVLGWPGNAHTLCDLAVVCASAPQACQTHLNGSAAINEALETIRENAEFHSKASMWRERLARPDLGYATSREKCQEWLEEGQSSVGNAKSRLGGHHTLRSGNSTVVRRRHIMRGLETWFADRMGGMAALVGDEGTGKSWAALDWCDEMRGTLGAASPLVVYLRATSVQGSDAKSDIARALSDQSGTGSAEFWRRRLNLWEKSGRQSIRLLVVVDGLNQKFLFRDWADWAQPLLEENLGGMYCLMVSCWANRWRDELLSLANLAPKPVEIAVEGFDDVELDELLAAMGVRREDLAEPVLNLMRIPRLAAIALKHHEALAESGDVTAERVIYEDWKDRIDRQGPAAGLDDARMKVFVASLGRELRNDVDRAVSRRNIMDILSHDSGRTGEELQAAASQLTSGGWFEEGDRPDRFKLHTERLHYVLGVALMSELKHGSASDVAGTIAEFLDPLKAHSLGSKILRAATTIALLDDGADDQLRRELVWRWLDEQNFSGEDFDAVWRLAGLDPDLFLGTAEREWLGARVNGTKDEVLIKALANAATFPRFDAVLKNKLVDWLGTAWPGPPIDANAQEQDGNGSAVRVGRLGDVQSRHEDWLRSPACKEFSPVRFRADGEWSSLGQRAVAVLSYLARAPYVAALEAWALSRALMESPKELEAVAWILRFNPKDPVEADEALENVLCRLEQHRHDTTGKAALHLRRAISSVQRERNVNHDGEAARNKAIQPTRHAAEKVPEENLFESVADYLSAEGWKRFDASIGAEVIDALIARGMPSGGREIDLLLRNFPDVVTIISPKSRELLAIAFEQELATVANGDSAPRAEKLGTSALLLKLYSVAPTEQRRLLLSAQYASIGDEWWCICRRPEISDLTELDISGASEEGLNLWLSFIGQHLKKEEIGYLDFLPFLTTHENREIRRRALYIASQGPHLEALIRFANSEYASPVSGNSRVDKLDEHARNIALLELESLPNGIVPAHPLSTESAALRVKWTDQSDEALDAFASYLDDELKEITIAKSWSLPRYWLSYLDCIKLLIERDRFPVEEWLTHWAKHAGRGADKALMNHFPVMDTMRALKDHAPEATLAAFQTIKQRIRHSIFSKDAYHEFPFEMVRSESSDTACDDCLASAVTDEELLNIAFYCHAHGRVGWLLEQIESLETRTRPSDVATAFTLLGCCDRSAEADSLWKAIQSRPPTDPWLRTVYEASREDYRRNVLARAALQEFWQTELDEPAARHAWKRVEANCDRRIGVWYRDIDPQTNDLPYARRLARSLGANGLREAVKRDRDRRKKLLFHTPISSNTMAPWR